MGKQDVIKHCSTQGHQQLAKALKSQPTLSFGSSSLNETLKRTEAEVRMAVLTASSDVPLAFHDRLSPTIRSSFADSKIAASYHSASTKATCMLNLAIAPMLKEDLVKTMMVNPFSVCIDGSNDTDLEKMNPVTVRIYDVNSGRVCTRFLDMCTCTSATAERIYNALDGKLAELLECTNPWTLCTSVGVDNTSVNIGIRNSLKTRIQQRNPAVYFNGCSCHIIHNAAQKGGDAFAKACGFDVEDFTVNVYY